MGSPASNNNNLPILQSVPKVNNSGSQGIPKELSHLFSMLANSKDTPLGDERWTAAATELGWNPSYGTEAQEWVQDAVSQAILAMAKVKSGKEFSQVDALKLALSRKSTKATIKALSECRSMLGLAGGPPLLTNPTRKRLKEEDSLQIQSIKSNIQATLGSCVGVMGLAANRPPLLITPAKKRLLKKEGGPNSLQLLCVRNLAKQVRDGEMTLHAVPAYLQEEVVAHAVEIEAAIRHRKLFTALARDSGLPPCKLVLR